MNPADVVQDPWRGIHNATRASILAGEYPPGSRLIEQQLADRFGTSRGPVRTALQELERTGLVVSRDRRGTFVRTLSDTDLEEIYSLWEVLLVFIVRRAAARVTQEDRDWVASFLARTSALTQPSDLLTAGVELTRRLLYMARHERAAEVYEALVTQARARSMFDHAATDAAYWTERTDFQPFCRALLDGDADGMIDASDGWLRRSQTYWMRGSAPASSA